MSKELIKMQEIRKAQIALRKKLKYNEDTNKDLRRRMGAMWGDESKKVELSALSGLLIGNRLSVRALQIALRELKRNLRTYNKQYDNIQFILNARNN